MGMIAPLDSAFLIEEAREHPMHVAGSQIIQTPTGEGEDHPGELYRELLTHTGFFALLAAVSSLCSRRRSSSDFWTISRTVCKNVSRFHPQALRQTNRKLIYDRARP